MKNTTNILLRRKAEVWKAALVIDGEFSDAFVVRSLAAILDDATADLVVTQGTALDGTEILIDIKVKHPEAPSGQAAP